MRLDELMKLCHFYNGEDDCPPAFDGKAEGKLWFSEKVVCEIMGEPGYENPSNPRYEFDNLVACHVAKWDPYGYMTVLEIYFQHSPVYKERILASL